MGYFEQFDYLQTKSKVIGYKDLFDFILQSVDTKSNSPSGIRERFQYVTGMTPNDFFDISNKLEIEKFINGGYEKSNLRHFNRLDKLLFTFIDKKDVLKKYLLLRYNDRFLDYCHTNHPNIGERMCHYIDGLDRYSLDIYALKNTVSTKIYASYDAIQKPGIRETQKRFTSSTVVFEHIKALAQRKLYNKRTKAEKSRDKIKEDKNGIKKLYYMDRKLSPVYDSAVDIERTLLENNVSTPKGILHLTSVGLALNKHLAAAQAKLKGLEQRVLDDLYSDEDLITEPERFSMKSTRRSTQREMALLQFSKEKLLIKMIEVVNPKNLKQMRKIESFFPEISPISTEYETELKKLEEQKSLNQVAGPEIV